ALVFGTPEEARRAIRRIGARHAGVTGVATDGRPYEARDPRLLLWVETTLILTSLRLYDLVRGPLGAREREAYWAEWRPVAAALGIPDDVLPRTLAGLEAFEREMLATEVLPDETSRELAAAVRRPSRLIPAPLLWPLDALTAAFLPPTVRVQFGLEWRTRERLLFRAVIVAVRALRRTLPDRLAIVPQARRYEDRVAR
ncbi:MAG TPA: oxygenase MpaB family protein, partial [Candidatus Limnocylindria bacterium]|nr:oxygenase MpaB family protein [Candidatus Limnocylindria bacterium]